MKKLILLSIVLGSYMFAGNHGEADNSLSQSNTENYSFIEGSSDDFKSDAGRRRGKQDRGRRRGGNGLR